MEREETVVTNQFAYLYNFMNHEESDRVVSGKEVAERKTSLLP